MQPSTDTVRPMTPGIQIHVNGSAMIRLYDGAKCVGFASTYRLAEARAAELEQAKRQGSVH